MQSNYPEHFLALLREKTNSLTLEESAEQLHAILRALDMTLPAATKSELFGLLPNYCSAPRHQTFFVRRPKLLATFHLKKYFQVVSANYRQASTAQVVNITKGFLHANKIVLEPGRYQLLLDLLPAQLRDRVL